MGRAGTVAVVYGSAKNAALYYDYVVDATSGSRLFDIDRDSEFGISQADVDHIMALHKIFPWHLEQHSEPEELSAFNSPGKLFPLASFRLIEPNKRGRPTFSLVEYLAPTRAKEINGISGYRIAFGCDGSLYREKPTIQIDGDDICMTNVRGGKWDVDAHIIIDAECVEILGSGGEVRKNGAIATLAGLPVIDAKRCPWEQIQQVRQDPKAINQLRRLRTTLNADYSGLGRAEIEDKLLSSIEDYHATARSCGLDYTLRSMSLLCGAGALPSLFAAASAVIGGSASAAALLAVGAFGFAGLSFEFARSGLTCSSELEKHPYAYILSTKNRLGPWISEQGISQ